jgi:hypothetical protein
MQQASRQSTWDLASKLTSDMLAAVPEGLDVQLVYFRGNGECVASRWLSDAASLSRTMSSIVCRAGITQIGRVLDHARKTNEVQKVGALVLISDAFEESDAEIYALARGVGVPVFMFQEGDDPEVAEVYAKIADLTGGAFCKFDSGAASKLAELLRAVAAFAAGGIKALADQNSEGARLLLT